MILLHQIKIKSTVYLWDLLNKQPTLAWKVDNGVYILTSAVDVGPWVSNYIPDKAMDLITDPRLNISGTLY